jgi:hypothetical protein
MLKYVSKFMLDVLPSLLATVIGAYIVNHYITKPEAPPAAVASTADPKTDAKASPEASKPAETSSDIVNIPEPGVRAKGISERAVLEKSAPERPAPEKSALEKPALEKPADKPAETASIPVETRRHQPAPREKTAARTAPPQPAAPAVVPAAAAPVVAAAPAPAETATSSEEHRDANDLARAAIERLRGSTESSPRSQEAARTPDAARIPDTPRVVMATPSEASRAAPASPLRPLPPPIMVSTPPREAADPAAETGDSRRPTPPADIPASQPLDLRAEATEPVREHRNVAEDMLSAAKSVFHAVLPK